MTNPGDLKELGGGVQLIHLCTMQRVSTAEQDLGPRSMCKSH